MIDKTINETRIRSKVCKTIISINSTLDLCSACSSKERLKRKRKLDTKLNDQKKTSNSSQPLANNKNILNIEVNDRNDSLQKKNYRSY